MRMYLLSGVLLFAAACGSSKSPEEKAMETSISMMEEIAKVVESSGDDCGKMSSGIEAVYKRHEGDLAAMKAMGEKMKSDPKKAEELQRLAMKYADKMSRLMPAMMGMMKCADDPKMKELKEKMDGLGM